MTVHYTHTTHAHLLPTTCLPHTHLPLHHHPTPLLLLLHTLPYPTPTTHPAPRLHTHRLRWLPGDTIPPGGACAHTHWTRYAAVRVAAHALRGFSRAAHTPAAARAPPASHSLPRRPNSWICLPRARGTADEHIPPPRCLHHTPHLLPRTTLQTHHYTHTHAHALPAHTPTPCRCYHHLTPAFSTPPTYPPAALLPPHTACTPLPHLYAPHYHRALLHYAGRGRSARFCPCAGARRGGQPGYSMMTYKSLCTAIVRTGTSGIPFGGGGTIILQFPVAMTPHAPATPATCHLPTLLTLTLLLPPTYCPVTALDMHGTGEGRGQCPPHHAHTPLPPPPPHTHTTPPPHAPPHATPTLHVTAITGQIFVDGYRRENAILTGLTSHRRTPLYGCM